MKTKSKISGYILRSSAATLLFSCAVVALSSAINLPNKSPKFPTPQSNAAFAVNGHESALSVAASAIPKNRTLTFADRVAYQRAIEEVYWQHRIWPKANAAPKPPLDKVMPQAQIEKKVEDYLRNSQALEDYWQRQITPDQLQAEMERIASHTKQPGVLREIFAALGNDPFVIAECLARPVLAERSVTELYAHDERFHGELKRRAKAELQTHRSLSQMKRTSGMYTEMEWIKSDSSETGSASADTKSVNAVKMNNSEWQKSIEKLAGEFGNAKAEEAWRQIKTGVLSPLREDDGHYYAVAVMKKGKDRLKLATVAWLKEPLRSWVTRSETEVPVTMAGVSANYALPAISSTSPDTCTDDTWTPTSLTNAPGSRAYHTAIWSGSEMILWGGENNGLLLNTGGRYNPTTDSWVATTATNAPAERYQHTAVWTGSEMIVWGGLGPGFLNSGGRYNPITDTWISTTTTDAPEARDGHTAVWTGSEMIVWGGVPTFNFSTLNTGGRYNPGTDSWVATTTTNAPEARGFHTAVWTGSQMIVWGGAGNSSFLNGGGKYNPSTDSWVATTTTNAPEARHNQTAVWTGSEMIVWGGVNFIPIYLNTGGRYNPSTDSWTATSTTNAPIGRYYHTVVWSGGEMIVWGGNDGNNNYLNTGGRYNPGTDNWTATSTTNVLAVRFAHTAVWTGSEMIIWGGVNTSAFSYPLGGYNSEMIAGGSSPAGGPPLNYLNSGGRYCAGTPTPTLGNYPDTSIPLSTDTTVIPDAAPTDTTSMNVSTNTNFQGTFAASPTTGVVTVTDAHPAGAYTVTVTAFGPGGTTTKTFTLTVTSTPCGVGFTDSFTNAADVNAGSGPYSVAIGDFNGDGKQDLAVVNNGENTVSIRLGDGLGGFSGSTNVSVGSFAYSVAIGDFNGDGNQDFAVANNGPANTVSIRLGDGLGGFSGSTEVTVGSLPISVAIGDFNGDGKQDLAVANTGSNTVAIRLGDGLGGFSGSTNVSVGSSPRSVAIGDFNGDGKQDLAVANTGSDTVAIRLGDGLGGFSGSTDVSVGSLPTSVAIGDFNNDGNQDFAVANLGSDTVSIRLGDGLGGFSGLTDVSVGSLPISVAIGDFNEDGKQDFAVANNGANTVSIRLGDGLGGFSGSTDLIVGSNLRFVAIGDFNRDGKQDLAVANSGSDTANIRLGECVPVPTPTPTPTPTATPTIQVRVRTNPTGPSFTVDGITYNSTQTFSWASGSSHTIATPSFQSGGTGVQYVWTKWSDHGSISHTVAPTTNTTYTATFKTQYYLTMTAGTGGRVSPISGWRNSGAAVSIIARPANQYSFSNWTGSGTGSYSGPNNPASITMNGPITETATFTHN